MQLEVIKLNQKKKLDAKLYCWAEGNCRAWWSFFLFFFHSAFTHNLISIMSKGSAQWWSCHTVAPRKPLGIMGFSTCMVQILDIIRNIQKVFSYFRILERSGGLSPQTKAPLLLHLHIIIMRNWHFLMCFSPNVSVCLSVTLGVWMSMWPPCCLFPDVPLYSFQLSVQLTWKCLVWYMMDGTKYVIFIISLCWQCVKQLWRDGKRDKGSTSMCVQFENYVFPFCVAFLPRCTFTPPPYPPLSCEAEHVLPHILIGLPVSGCTWPNSREAFTS